MYGRLWRTIAAVSLRSTTTTSASSPANQVNQKPSISPSSPRPINPNTPRTGMLRDHSAVHLVTALYLYNFHGEPGNIDAALLGPRRGRSSLVWQ